MGTALTVFLAYVGVGVVVAICGAVSAYANWRSAEDAIFTGIVAGLGWPVIVIAAPVYVVAGLIRLVIYDRR